MKWIALAVVLGSCTTHKDPAAKPDLGERLRAAHVRMHGRFEASDRMQIAIGLGDLERARAEAREIMTRTEPDFLPEWQAYADEIAGVARGVAATQDTVEAAKAAGKLGGVCGRCHLAMSAKVTFAVEPPPPPGDRLAAVMRSHQWAGLRMWEGLVGPDDERWRQGSRALVESRIAADPTAAGGDIAQMHQLATRAEHAEKQERGTLYGELLATCAHCHAAIRDTAKRP
jgi:cytochrome c553